MLPKLRRLYLTGKHEEAQDVFAEIVRQSGSKRRLNAYHGVGDLTLQCSHAGPIEDYERTLDMRKGIARVSYLAGGVGFTRTYFVDFDADLAVIEIQADRAGAVSATVGLRRDAVRGCKLTASADATSLRLEGTYPDATRFDVRAALVYPGGTANVEKAEYAGAGESGRDPRCDADHRCEFAHRRLRARRRGRGQVGRRG